MIKLCHDLGLLNVKSLDDTAREGVIEELRCFYLAGGIMTWSVWKELSADEKTLFLEARQRVEKSLSQLIERQLALMSETSR